MNTVKQFPTNNNLGKWVTSIVILVIIVFLGVNSFVVVPAGHRGVLLQLGNVKGVLDEGLNFKLPFIQNVELMEVRIKKNEEEQHASTKDLQTVKTNVAVNYRLDPNGVNKLYQEVGLDFEERIITPSISEALKSVTAQYKADELISKREDVSMKIKEVLEEKIGKYNILLSEINIREFRFSETFEKSIESKQEAEQLALKAQRDLDRIKIEAEQKVTQAKAEAESLRLKSQNLTSDLVKLKEIEVQEKALEKWDGKLPSVTGGGAVPFVDIGIGK